MLALRIFGCLVGVLMVVYGVAVMDDALIETGPCRANCGLYSALIRLFGQSAYNRLMGFSWVVAGVMFIFVSVVVWHGKGSARKGVGKKRDADVDRDERMKYLRRSKSCVKALPRIASTSVPSEPRMASV